MKTSISIKLDKQIKQEAQAVAEKLGLSLSAVVNATLCEFVRTKELHVTIGLKPTPYLARILDQAERDFQEGKNLSPIFDNTKDAITHLRSEVRKIRKHETRIPSSIHQRTLKTAT